MSCLCEFVCVVCVWCGLGGVSCNGVLYVCRVGVGVCVCVVCVCVCVNLF